MSALAADRYTSEKDGKFRTVGVAAGVKIFAGSLVVMSATGFAKPGYGAAGLIALGRAEYQADNTAGADGAITVKVRLGTFNFVSGTAGDAITIANRGAAVYVIDDQTVGLTSNSGARSIAGTVFDVDADGVWVKFS